MLGGGLVGSDHTMRSYSTQAGVQEAQGTRLWWLGTGRKVVVQVQKIPHSLHIGHT
jgi:hypothetical protein